jgi:uroporphyrin-III C-methyltransferase/precorrin-2 dehydrogenase/sirohydrochlorin ferrochelatase
MGIREGRPAVADEWVIVRRPALLAQGGRRDLPFALVENGSRREQRVVSGVLDSLPGLARHHAVTSPALLILGDVAALATQLHWYGAPPLTACDPTPADRVPRAA